jgi:hypothetical protein
MHFIIRFGRYGAGTCLAAAILAACGSGTSGFDPSGAPSGHQTGLTALSALREAALTMPRFVAPVLHTDRGQSWMRPDKSEKTALFYVGDWSTNDVFAYDYKSGKQVGQLTGLSDPYGMCVDAKGDIYIANFGNGTVEEYAHGGTSPINTYSPGGAPIGCAVDSKGDLAATSFDPAAVTVYAGGDPSKATTYSDKLCEYLWTMGYDNKGDLVGIGESSSIVICAVLAGSKTMTTLAYDSGSGVTIDFPGGTTWDGKYLALSDQEAGGGFEGGIVQARLKGKRLVYVGKTVLDDNCFGDYVDLVNPFIAGKTNALWNGEQGNAVVGPNLWCQDAGTSQVGYWHYPSGGNPFKTLGSPPANPYGAGVSISSK